MKIKMTVFAGIIILITVLGLFFWNLYFSSKHTNDYVGKWYRLDPDNASTKQVSIKINNDNTYVFNGKGGTISFLINEEVETFPLKDENGVYSISNGNIILSPDEEFASEGIVTCNLIETDKMRCNTRYGHIFIRK